MKVHQSLRRGGFVAGACVACCAPPIIAVLGVTTGLAVTAGVFLGLAAAITVVLFGGSWIIARTRGHAGRRPDTVAMADPVAVRSDDESLRSSQP